MRQRPRYSCLLQAFLLVCTLSLTGCENGNLFGGLNDRGDSGDIETLNADAGLAIREGNYSQALNLYQRVLAQAPNNSEALYGAATAAMGNTGLSLGKLLTNLTDELDSSSMSSIHNLGDLVAQSRLSTSASFAADQDSVLFGIDLDPLNAVIDNVICWMNLIVGGVADGTIDPNNPNNAYILLDLGLLCVIRGVLRLIRGNWGDLTNVNGDYEFTVDMAAIDTACQDPTDKEVIVQIAKDAVGAFALYKRAVDLLAASGNAVIVELRDEIEDGLQQLLESGAEAILPASCITLLENQVPPIQLSDFTSYTEVFDDPPSSCPAL
ncbi:hypothetical protein BVX98_04080 [bacterium F11]|nr:hypothetical protein BVX98_04080 [bacterium F11]